MDKSSRWMKITLFGTPLLPITLIAVAIISLTAGSVIRTLKQVKDRVAASLQTIADLKTQQIADWVSERDGDRRFVQSSRFFALTYNRWQKAGDAAGGEALKKRLNEYRKDRFFQGALLLDEHGVVLWDSDGLTPALNPVLKTAVRLASTGGKSTIVGPYRDAGGRLRMDLVASLLLVDDNSRPVIVLRIDPEVHLFPTLQTWPIPSASGKTLLFRRDGDQVLFLNAPSPHKEIATLLRVPLAGKSLLAAKVMRGKGVGSLVEGLDYSGVPVMGVAQIIPGTDWFLAAEIDKAEAFGSAKRYALGIALFGFLTLFVAAAGFSLFRQHQELSFSLRERETQAEKLRALQLLGAIAESSADVIFAKDLGGRYLLFNSEAAKITGKRAEDILGQDDSSLFPPEQAALLMANDRRAMAESTTISLYEEITTVEGKRTFFSTKGPLRDAEGKVIGMYGISRDITERMKVETALRESRERYRRIVEIALEGVFTADENNIVTYVNQRIADMLGYTIEEIVGKPVVHFLFPEDLADHQEKWSNRTQGKSEIYERRFRQRDGGERWVLVSVTAVRDDEGSFMGILGMLTDITERRKAEEALRLSERRLRRAEVVARFGNWELIPGCNKVKASEGAKIIYGLEGSEWSIAQIQAPALAEYRGMLDQALKELIEEGKPYNVEYKIRRPNDGKVIDIHSIAEYSREEGVVFGVLQDISESRRAKEEKEKLEAQLFQAQKMESIGRLAGGVAHDFNNMLGVIIGRAEIALQQEIINDELQHDLKEILNAGLRSADLTRQLLAFARRQTAVPKILDLNETISGMLKMLRRLIGEDIDLSFHPGLDQFKVKIDPSQVDQILANLSVNARDAISGAGAIAIKTHNVVIEDSIRAQTPEFIPGQYVLLTVSDTGTGMNQEVLDNIFEPFFTTKEWGKGTGLGLSTVYGIIKQNGGFIHIASEPGKGTTFKIYLPGVEDETAQAPIEEVRDKPHGGTETILLVEDDNAILNLGKIMLEKLGYTVLAAPTPAVAIHIADRHPGDIHMLVTDVVMPQMHGKELALKLGAIRSNLKCLYMSGYTADVIANSGLLHEGLNFIQKPFSRDTFAAKVREVLDHSLCIARI